MTIRKHLENPKWKITGFGMISNLQNVHPGFATVSFNTPQVINGVTWSAGWAKKKKAGHARTMREGKALAINVLKEITTPGFDPTTYDWD